MKKDNYMERVLIGPLDSLVNSITTKSKLLDPAHKARLEAILASGITVVEVLHSIVKEEERHFGDLLNTVVDEVFIDLHIALTLAMSEQIKPACVLLRVFLEESIYILYFLDHPIECQLWANHSEDMSFGAVLSSFEKPSYFSIASRRSIDEEQIETSVRQLRESYRALSERVHGKFAFLQSLSGSSENALNRFIDLAETVSASLIRLSFQRTSTPDNLRLAIPAIERALK